MAKKTETVDAAAPEDGAIGSAENTAESTAESTAVTKRAFLDRIQTATGANKRAVRDIVEATLSEIAAILSKGEQLVLPPLGRVTVQRMAKGDNPSLVLRLRPTGPRTKKAEEGVAAPAEAE